MGHLAATEPGVRHGGLVRRCLPSGKGSTRRARRTRRSWLAGLPASHLNALQSVPTSAVAWPAPSAKLSCGFGTSRRVERGNEVARTGNLGRSRRRRLAATFLLLVAQAR